MNPTQTPTEPGPRERSLTPMEERLFRLWDGQLVHNGARLSSRFVRQLCREAVECLAPAPAAPEAVAKEYPSVNGLLVALCDDASACLAVVQRDAMNMRLAEDGKFYDTHNYRPASVVFPYLKSEHDALEFIHKHADHPTPAVGPAAPAEQGDALHPHSEPDAEQEAFYQEAKAAREQRDQEEESSAPAQEEGQSMERLLASYLYLRNLDQKEIARLREQLAAAVEQNNRYHNDVNTLCARRNDLEKEIEGLRLRLLSAAGDDLCRLTQEEIKAYTSGEVQIPPKEEFLASCERFHQQIAGGPGVLSGCLTLAQLISENEKLTTELQSAHEALDANWVTHQQIKAAEARVAEITRQVESQRAELIDRRKQVSELLGQHPAA